MRKHYIDNLRSIIILLLIPYHAAMAWNIWGEPNYIHFGGNRGICSIVVFLSPYIMPCLFLLAGIVTKFALQKKTISQYIAERCKKLLVPFVFGTLLLMPLMTYLAGKFNNGYSGGFFRHYSTFFTRFTDLTGADGGFSVGQFWFIIYLFIISLIAVGIISVQKKIKPECKMSIPLTVLCLLGLPLPFLNGLLSVGGKSIVEYTYIFLIGYYVFSDDEAIEKAEKHRWLFLLVGGMSALFNVYLFVLSDVKYPLLNTVMKFTAEWFMLLALLGIGKRYLNFGGKASAYLSQRSFAFYIWHFIWVVIFQYLLFRICKNTLLLYVLPVILAYAATLLCCEISINIPLLRFLTGDKSTTPRTKGEK